MLRRGLRAGCGVVSRGVFGAGVGGFSVAPASVGGFLAGKGAALGSAATPGELARERRRQSVDGGAGGGGGEGGEKEAVAKKVMARALEDDVDKEALRSEVSDANVIFSTAWRNIEERFGKERMIFPKEIIWLAGAPGAGKGTMSGYIMRERDLAHGPIEVSSLLKGPKFESLKEKGKLVGDRDVVEALLEELLDPKYADGVVVDGFPRTHVQAQCIKALSEKMRAMRFSYRNHPTLRSAFRRPLFRITVLYVEEEESIRRQLKRAKEVERLNRRAEDTGIGKKVVARATDLDETLARERYRVFKEEVYDAIRSIQNDFFFHLIPADAPPEQVSAAIVRELTYQSALELDDDTFEMVRRITPASEIVRAARQKLVQRLNAYANDYADLFVQVLDLIDAEFMHILQRQALAGQAIIRSENPILSSPIAVNMTLDILSERGYFVALDIKQDHIPVRVAPAIAGDMAGAAVTTEKKKAFIFHVEFPRPHIRRPDDVA